MEQFKDAIHDFDTFEQSANMDALEYLARESQLVAAMQRASGSTQAPRPDEQRIDILISGSLMHVQQAITLEQDQGQLNLFGMTFHQFQPHFIRISSYAKYAHLRKQRSNESNESKNMYGWQGRHIARRATEVNDGNDNDNAKVFSARANSGTIDENNWRVKELAKSTGLTFCAHHGWCADHATDTCPDPPLNDLCRNGTNGGHCSRGRMCKHKHIPLTLLSLRGVSNQCRKRSVVATPQHIAVVTFSLTQRMTQMERKHL